MEDKRTKFLRAFQNLPENLREDTLVLIDKKPYSWNVAYFEISEKTELGEKILKTLESMKII